MESVYVEGLAYRWSGGPSGENYADPLENFPEAKWDALLAVHLSAALHLSKAFWADMKACHFGRLIFISSVHGLRASEFKSAYVAAKEHGLQEQ